MGESEIWSLYAELTNSLPGQTAETQQKVVMWKFHLVYIENKMYIHLYYWKTYILSMDS